MKKIKEVTMVKRLFGLIGEEKGKEEPVSGIKEAAEKAKEDKSCFGYYVYERKYFVLYGYRFYDKGSKCIKNVVFGRILTREQIQKMNYNEKDLILERMDEDGAKQVFHTRTNKWLSIEDLGKNAKIIDC